jgi:hypothetical protein
VLWSTGEKSWQPLSDLEGASEAVEAYRTTHSKSMLTEWRRTSKAVGMEAPRAPDADNTVVNVDEALPLALMSRLNDLKPQHAQPVMPEPSWRPLDEEVVSMVPPVSKTDQMVQRMQRQLAAVPLSEGTARRLARRIGLLELVALKSVAPISPGDIAEPLDVHDAKKSPGWMASMHEELQSFEDFGVWELVVPPPGANLVSCKWVFKTKRDAEGKPARLKSRLTARGFTQRKGKDYWTTWAPTCRQRTFRVLLAEASTVPASELVTGQWDCTAAFLHADIDREVYMDQPPGFVKPGEEHLKCRLLKSIYGLKQSSHLFYEMVRNHLVLPCDQGGEGASQSVVDPCFFTIQRGGKWLKMALHVDDAAVFSNSRELYDDVFKGMLRIFKIRDDPLEHFLGVVVSRAPDGAFLLSQKPYIEELLVRLGLEDSPTALSPSRGGKAGRLTKEMSPRNQAERNTMASVPYAQAVGALHWLVRATCPLIAHAVAEVARFVSDPGHLHWQAVVRIFCYLKRVKDVPFRVKSDGTMHLAAYSDASWTSCDDAKSYTAFFVYVGGALVSWRSRRQPEWAQSATEAEYIAAVAASNECVWWRNIIEEMWRQGERMPATQIFVDNTGAIQQSQHACAFDATKHYKLAWHVVRDRTEKAELELRPIRSSLELADVISKNLHPGSFIKMGSLALGMNIGVT